MPEISQPNDAVIRKVQKEEIDRLNENRISLLATIDMLTDQANEMINQQGIEIQRLFGVISQLKGMLSEDVIEEAEALIANRLET